MNNSSSVSGELSIAYDGPAAERYTEGTFLLLITLTALIGNVSLWIVVIRDKRLRTPANALILCLSAADLLVSSLNMPITVYTLFLGYWAFSDSFCRFLGFLNMVTFVGSVMSLCAIAVSRYHMVYMAGKFRRMYIPRNVGLIIMGVWLLTLLLAMPPLVGWAEYAYISNQSFCFCNWRDSVSYAYFMVVVCFGGPCTTMSFCYIKILKKFKKSIRKMEGYADARKSSARPLGSAKSVRSISSVISGKKNKINPEGSSGQTEIEELPSSRPTSGHPISSRPPTGMSSASRPPSALPSASRPASGHPSASRPPSSRPGSVFRGFFGGRGNVAPVGEVDYGPEFLSGDPSQQYSEDTLDIFEDEGSDEGDDLNSDDDDRPVTRADIDISTRDATLAEMTRNNPTPGSAMSKRSIIHVKSASNAMAKRKKSATVLARIEERKLTKSLLVVVVIFVVCWFPFCVTLLWNAHSEDDIPRAPDIISLLMGYCNSCINPIVYGVMNKRFKVGFRALFRSLFCRCCGEDKNNIVSETSGTMST